MGEVEVTRRIERGAGSAYRVNGRDVRQKDVALLFADAATGAHSPALVSQGKISAVIAAKPTERRLMLEEAAGIAGLHVRRKDAEQKLRATEANLIRLDEILADMELRGGALQAPGAGGRALPQAFRPDPGRRGAADLRALARGGGGGRGGAGARPRRPTAAVATAAEAQRAAAAWQTEAAAALADQRKAAEAARERASALGHKLAALRAERDGVAPPDRRAGGAPPHPGRRPRARGGAEGRRRRRDRAGSRRSWRRSPPGSPRPRAGAARSTCAPSSMRTRPAPPRPRSARPARSRPPSRPRRASPRPRCDAARARSSPAPRPRRRGSPSRWPALGGDADLVATLAGRANRREQAEAALAAGGRGDRRRRGRRASSAAAARDAAESEAASARAALAALQSEAQALLEGGRDVGRRPRDQPYQGRAGL